MSDLRIRLAISRKTDTAMLLPFREVEALLAVVEAAQAVAEFEQTYAKHDDNSSEDGPPTCTICGEWGDRIYALDDALAALTTEQKPGASYWCKADRTLPCTCGESDNPGQCQRLPL